MLLFDPAHNILIYIQHFLCKFNVKHAIIDLNNNVSFKIFEKDLRELKKKKYWQTDGHICTQAEITSQCSWKVLKSYKSEVIPNIPKYNFYICAESFSRWIHCSNLVRSGSMFRILS